MSETEEPGEADVLDLRDYGRTIWRHRLLIAITVVVTAGAAIALSVMQTPSYTATAQLIIQHSDSIDSTPQDAQDAQRNVDTETAVLQSKVVEQAAQRALGHKPSVSISSDPNSDVVGVSASSSSAKQAAADANAYADAYVSLRRTQNIDDLTQASQQVQAKITTVYATLPTLAAGSPELAAAQSQLTYLQQQLDQLQVSTNLNEVAGARMLAPATPPAASTSPKPKRNVAIAIVLGLLLGIGLAFLREYFDDTVGSREDLERATNGLPVLGEVPRIPGWHDRQESHLVIAESPNSYAAESYRTLRTSIEFLAFDRELKSIQLTSSQADDGKTTTLANLALAFARSGIQVTIVCCDLRRPRVHEFFGLRNEVGFTSVLLGRSAVLDALQQVEGEPNLAVLTSGPPPPNPSELLSSRRAGATISSIATSSATGLLFVDSPPVLPVGDALIVSGMVDATLLVASQGSSSRRALQRTVQMLRQVNAPLMGTVLNDADISDPDAAFGYGYITPSSNGSNAVETRRLRRKENRTAR